MVSSIKATAQERYVRLVRALVAKRQAAGITQQAIGEILNLDQSSISRYEARELQLDIELLTRWCESLDDTLENVLRASGFLDDGGEAVSRRNIREVHGSNETAYPVGVNATVGGFDLILQWTDQLFMIPFLGSDVEKYRSIERTHGIYWQCD